MMTELTDKLIQDAFAETSIDPKYYPQYEAEVKRRYKELQKEDPDYEESPDKDNAHVSIDLTNEYIVYYVAEIEKGHCQQWAHSFADNLVLEENEESAIRSALEELNEEDKQKELEIHANSINIDPVFVERYTFLFDLGEPDVREKAEDYCRAYHKCIKQSKSDIYAHAYADAVNENYYEEYCEIYAEAYEVATNHGQDDSEAYLFGDFCTDAADQGYWLMLNKFKTEFKEDWQKEFYMLLIKRELEQEEKRPLTARELKELREEFFDN